MNGVAERFNWSAIEALRTTIVDDNMDRMWWAEVLMAYTHVKNRLSQKLLEGQTPYERVVVKDERQSGSMGNWDRVVKQHPTMGQYPNRFDATLSYQGQKFRSAKSVIKYCEDNKIDYSRESVKDSFKYNNPYMGPWDIRKVGDGAATDSPDADSPDESHVSSTSVSNLVDLAVYFEGLECSNVDSANPLTYSEAIASPDKSDWETAMGDEVETLRERNVFKEVDKTPQMKNDKIKLHVITLLNKSFKCVDLGKTKRFLGIDIIREEEGIRFSQTSYVEELSKRFSNYVFKKVAEPFKVGFDIAELNLEGDVLDASQYPYRTMVGILLFISRYTRPDISIAIGILARYNAKPKLIHWNCIMHLWNYVVSTKEKCIHLSGNSNLKVNCYVDASWMTTIPDRKSVMGYLIMIGNNLILWRTTKQSLITMSAMEAELIALSELVKEVIWFKCCLDEVRNVQNLDFGGIVVNCDNQAGMHFIRNDVENSKTKYIDVKLQFVREHYKSHLFSLKYIYTKKNLADILTKRVNREKIVELCKYLDIYC
uniref:MBD domain-containing protein n=1 Tax=Strigamia maritima TaxID=126957 RepID=T1IMN5_STRMM